MPMASPPIESLPIPPVSRIGPPEAKIVKSKEEAKRAEEKLEIEQIGNAAAKLLPESSKEGNSEDSSATPLLNDNDQRCYASRFSDLKGA
jgi:hypothetical protein